MEESEPGWGGVGWGGVGWGGVGMRHEGRKERVRRTMGTISRRAQSQGVERYQYPPSEDWLQCQQCMEWYHNHEACGNSLAVCGLYDPQWNTESCEVGLLLLLVVTVG